MRRWCFLLPAMLLPVTQIDWPRAGAQVVINEVYCDHPGADGGWEFIELFNPGDGGVDCSGLSLEFVDGASGGARVLWTAPAGCVIRAGACLLIGGSEYGPPAAFELDGRLENGPDAVRLLRGGTPVDCVGYGGESLAPCEGSPFPTVRAGRSIARCPDGADTGDNAADLVDADPTPGRRNFYEQDCALSSPARDILCCAGDPVEIGLSILNTGLGPFIAVATVRASWIGTQTGSGIGDIVDIDLQPGDLIDLFVTMPPAHAGGCVVAVLEAPGDGDPLNDTVRVDVGLSPGAVVIGEVMYRPGPGEGEWVELYCRSALDVDLSGWSLVDGAGGSGAVPEGTVIAAGRYIVVAQDPSGFLARRPLCASPLTGTVSGWPRLNDSEDGEWADIVALLDAAGRTIDMVPYRALCDDERGRSIERVSAEACGAASEGVMQRCLDPDGATPGTVNSVDSPLRPGAGVLAEPNPFGRSRHGAVRITAELRGTEEAFTASVYDIDGVLVRRLAAGRSGAPVVSFLWDGLDDGGRPVPVGIYVCVVEFMVRGGGICRREQCVIVIGGS